ncbi:hypothetical protein BH24ACT26_BH24ACT26_21060 [soil metagenome]
MSKRACAVVVAVVAIAMIAPAGSAAAGGFCAGYAGEIMSDARGDSVQMKDNCFTPTVLRVEVGDTVTWVNGDSEAHAVGGTAGSFGDMHKVIRPAKSVSYRFEDEGVFPYVCIYHPGMAGAIVVGDGEGNATKSSGGPVAGPPELPGDRTSQAAAATTSEDREQSTTEMLAALAFLVVLAAVVARLVLSARRGSMSPSV